MGKLLSKKGQIHASFDFWRLLCSNDFNWNSIQVTSLIRTFCLLNTYSN